MIDALDVSKSKLGSLIEAEPIFSLLDKENVVLQAVEKRKTSVVFETTYFGVLLGFAIYDVLGGWTWESL